MVKVPNHNLQALAAQAAAANQSVNTTADKDRPPAGQDLLTETWNEESAKKNLEREGVISPTQSQDKGGLAPLLI